MMSEGNFKLDFDRGTLVFGSIDKNEASLFDNVLFDERTLQYRSPARYYRDVVLTSIKNKLTIKDSARNYDKLNLHLKHKIIPREHQEKAFSAWCNEGRSGVVSLPTGAGKTILAVMAIATTNRPTLVVVPTIDLLLQWQKVLQDFFDQEIGVLGGGKRNVRDLTVATYDTASLTIEQYGNRFGLLVFDECHHLPAAKYQMIALGSIAPFRLGLSATVERSDGLENKIFELLGPMVYEAEIKQMSSKVLAPYDVVSVQVSLTEKEHEQYVASRKIYTDFIAHSGVNFSSPQGWMDFVIRSSRSPEGRRAMKAYREQKNLAQAASAKKDELWKILENHRDDRIIVFTNDNAFAYEIGREFLLYVLTHHTKLKERKAMLADFKSGVVNVLVTSKVLNEGVDVPEASVGVVMSGSGAVREHVQRLGRILRHKPGKRSVLYEIVARNTGEQSVNKRRRKHSAYQKPS